MITITITFFILSFLFSFIKIFINDLFDFFFYIWRSRSFLCKKRLENSLKLATQRTKAACFGLFCSFSYEPPKKLPIYFLLFIKWMFLKCNMFYEICLSQELYEVLDKIQYGLTPIMLWRLFLLLFRERDAWCVSSLFMIFQSSL